jgi:hypothetical protein
VLACTGGDRVCVLRRPHAPSPKWKVHPLFAVLFVLVSALAPGLRMTDAEQRPNLNVFLADDLGYDDTTPTSHP